MSFVAPEPASAIALLCTVQIQRVRNDPLRHACVVVPLVSPPRVTDLDPYRLVWQISSLLSDRRRRPTSLLGRNSEEATSAQRSCTVLPTDRHAVRSFLWPGSVSGASDRASLYNAVHETCTLPRSIVRRRRCTHVRIASACFFLVCGLHLSTWVPLSC